MSAVKISKALGSVSGENETSHLVSSQTAAAAVPTLKSIFFHCFSLQ
jgi:hypothetical protein